MKNQGELEQLIRLAQVHGDPDLTRLKEKSEAYHLAMATVITHLCSTQSRSGVSNWAVGGNWVAIRLADPITTKAGTGTAVTNSRRSLLVAIAVAGKLACAPQGWLLASGGEQVDQTVLWRVMQLDNFEVDSWSMKPGRMIAARQAMFATGAGPLGPCGCGPFEETAFANLVYMMVIEEKRLAQYVCDAIGYCVRGAGSAGNLLALVAETSMSYGDRHVLVGYSLAAALCYAGSCHFNLLEATAIMAAVKESGTTKPSNSVHNKRATAADTFDHVSWAFHALVAEFGFKRNAPLTIAATSNAT